MYENLDNVLAGSNNLATHDSDIQGNYSNEDVRRMRDIPIRHVSFCNDQSNAIVQSMRLEPRSKSTYPCYISSAAMTSDTKLGIDLMRSNQYQAYSR